ncbi:conjugative transposon protein TraK [Pararcticibacter amylolyticus]|uniref:Conjugative transposon protein TraK n=1 Tax=Pararcticibacter amylolyticus TaxID=2173175 RepID=A0A2U2PHE8_9SPHI|nr:conjugative transposon protein TraK [Pararcticibacter amylolyticus]PWG80800.1 conjugative transposon protein TraK [Pararcticibacter amylolyticus]
MFTQLKNIDTAFQHIKRFSLFLVVACILISGFAVYTSFDMVKTVQGKIYILANGKALEAFSAERKDNVAVEARDHIGMFHHWFFTLDPDEKVIQANMGKALNLADESARKNYENLKEQGYYNNIISANISQEISIDSIQLDISEYPYHFRCYATQKLIRSSTAVTRKLVTQGWLRNVSRSDNNPHGFLIQKWETLLNQDVNPNAAKQ